MHFSALKQSAFKRISKGVVAMCGVAIALFLVLSASILSPGLSSKFPFHAECQLQWTWSNTNCSTVHEALLNQVKKWQGEENCKQGGEKCRYKLVSDSKVEMDVQHTTPVKKYVDDISFKFCDGRTCETVRLDQNRLKRGVKLMDKLLYSTDKGCAVSGFSISEVWYAVFDYGTNYCNMRNLADGAGLTKSADFAEQTSDDICTLYSSADCATY